jgi:hypothetical protein
VTVGSERGAGAPSEGGESGPAWPYALATIATVGFAALILAAGALLPPLHERSTTYLSADVRHETIVAALERGLAPLHPLILDATVEPGPASAAPELGHRATVTFSMLGVPSPTRVKLFVDVGGHWGGTPDGSTGELAIWSLLTPLVVLGSPWLVWRLRGRLRDRRRRADGPDPADRLDTADQSVRPTA